MIIKKYITIVVLILFSLFGQPPNLAAAAPPPSNEMLVRVYKTSQAPVFLKYMTQRRNALKALAASLSGQHGDVSIDTILKGVLLNDDLNTIAKQYFIKNWDFAIAPKSASLFEQKPYAQLLALESASGAPEKKMHFALI